LVYLQCIEKLRVLPPCVLRQQEPQAWLFNGQLGWRAAALSSLPVTSPGKRRQQGKVDAIAAIHFGFKSAKSR
jgi:hypothetical protein